jgi:cytochrome P450
MTASIPIPSAPGPDPMWGIGATGNVVHYIRDPIGGAGRLFARYGKVASVVRAPVRMVNPGPGPGWGTGPLATARGAGVVVVNGADLNREVLTQHERYHMIALPGRLFPTTRAPTARERPLQRTMTGLFHVNGDEHRRHRRLLMPAFHKTHIDAYRDDMVRITEGILERYRAGATRDVHADMTELTLRVATKTLFGGEEGARGLLLSQMMQRWLLAMVSPAMLLRADLPGLPYRRFLNFTRDIDRETVAIVKRARSRGGAGGTDMLSTLIAARDEDGSALGEDDLIGHAGVIFAAGHETSTNALAWTFLLLSQHLDVAGDLADELDAVLRGAPPTVDDLARLPLLNQRS